ncbi:hypothetical protein BC941DRAFT_441510, partial [Chlamydoabsidia padenii]
MPLAGEHRLPFYTVLVCNSCHTVWQRDVNASRNTNTLFSYAAINNNRRPFAHLSVLQT